jgi:hypothetical protein
MNPRVLVAIAVCAVVAAGVYFFTSWGVGRSTTPAEHGEKSAIQSASGRDPDTTAEGVGKFSDGAGKSGAKAGKMDWDFLTAIDGEKAREAPKEQDIVRFLAKHGETPANLIAAFESTGDRRWIERALERFPNSPLVLMKAVDATGEKSSPKEGEAYQVNKEKLALIERFKTADPNNPVPWIFAAQEFFKAKQTADGIAEIRATLDRPGFYVYANERMDASQRLYESLGIGTLEASALATFGLTLPHMSAAQQASRGLMEWQKSAAESGDTAAANEALQLTYGLGRTFATPEASRLLIGQLIGLSMEKRALDALSADAQPGWLTVDRTQRLAEIEKEKQLAREVSANSEWALKSRDEQLLSEWLRRVRNESEAVALEWLKTQRK